MIVIDVVLPAALAALAAEVGAEPGVALTAAVAALLARYAGRDEVAIVVTIEGVPRLARVALTRDPDARELVSRVKAALADAPPYDGQACDHVLPGAGEDAQVTIAIGVPAPPA